MPPFGFLDPTGRDKPPPAIWRGPDRHSRDACFDGTRAPVSVLFHFLAEGADIDACLEAYPTVRRSQVLAVLEHAAFHLVQEDAFTREAPPRVDKANLRHSVAAMLRLWEDGWEERLAWWRTWPPPEPRPKRLVRWADEAARCPTCHERPEQRAGRADG